MDILALAYNSAGKPDLALPLFEETLKLRKAKLGPDHPDTFRSMKNLADAYYAAGKLDLTPPLWEEMLKLMKAKLGPDHSDTLTCMNSLAEAYREAGKLDLAIQLDEETLKLRIAKLGPEHPDTLMSMSNLALAYYDAGKTVFAIQLDEETLKIRKIKLGPEHPDTLDSMDNLAVAYHAAGKVGLALPLFEEALKLMKAKLGPDHPTTLMCMQSLAMTYHNAGKLDRALPLLEETLKLRRAKLGPDHPNTLETAARLGLDYKDAGRFVEAFPLLEEAYRGAKKYPGLRWVGTALLDGYVRAGKAEQAANLTKELVADARTECLKESPQLAGQLAPIALLLLQANAFTEAEPLLRECLSIREKTQPDEWSTFNSKSMLGGALLGQKKYAEAEPLLLAGYEGLKQREVKIPPLGKVRLNEALERLVQLDEALEKKDDAAKWRKKLESRKESPERVQPAEKTETPAALQLLVDARGQWKLPPHAPPPAIAPFDVVGAQGHQAACAKDLGVPVQISNAIGMKLVFIPPGEFEMGSPKELIEEEVKGHVGQHWYTDHLPEEGPKHRVRITRPFYLGVYEVMQGEYQRVMGTNPSEFSVTGKEKDKIAGQDTKRFPVEHVAWDEAVQFCRKLSELPEEKAAGRTYRLPSEAQWEYACRAENAGRWFFSASLVLFRSHLK